MQAIFEDEFFEARLKKLYPQLVFHTPKIRNRSEMVYPENLSAGNLADEHMILI